MEARQAQTVSEIYDDFKERTPPATVLIRYNETTVTAGDLYRMVDRFTGHLAGYGVKPGAFVGYTMPNCPEIFALFIAISRLGGCGVPLFHMIPDTGKADIFRRINPVVVITTAQQYPGLQEASAKTMASYKIATIDSNTDCAYSFADPAPAGDTPLAVPPGIPLLVASSSGTTGIPKQVILTQANIASEIRASIAMSVPLDESIPPDYTIGMVFPLSTAGITTCIGYLFGGKTQVYSDDLSPARFVRLLTYWKVDGCAGPPAYFEGILALPLLDSLDLSSIKIIGTGMDFLTLSLLMRLKAKFPNLRYYSNGYGLIETTNVIMHNKDLITPDTQTNRLQLIPGLGNTIEVRNEEGKPVAPGSEGELFVRGTNVIQGYAGNPEATAGSFNDGWFKTGDIVRYEGENTVTLLSRRKYLIKRGGKSVSPVVVQDHLNKLEGVKNSAVTGIPHPLYGEMIWAFIVLIPGSPVQLKDIMRHCRTELPAYMVPDSVQFITDIPKNPGVGKINYEALKELANKEIARLEK